MNVDLRALSRNTYRSAEASHERMLAKQGRYCFAQDDQTVANAAGAAVRADINANLQALVTVSSGTAAPATTWAYQFWADTTNGLLKQRNAANAAWLVRGSLAETFLLTRSSNTILGVADFGRTFQCTSNFTQTLTAAATLTDGWMAFFQVADGVTITIDPNGAETIDGGATKVVVGPASGSIHCNGSAFFTCGFALDASKTRAANLLYAGPTSGTAAPTWRQGVPADIAFGQLSAYGTADVSLSTAGQFFDGPSITQGTAGTWWVTAGASLNNVTANSDFVAKLWDGTTVIDAKRIRGSGNGSDFTSLKLEGYIANPAGNLRISVKENSFTTAKIAFNASGGSKDSNISAFRIA